MSNQPETADAYTEPAEMPEPDRTGDEVGFYPAADHAAHAYAAMFRLDADRSGTDFRQRLYYALSEAACAKLDAGEDLVVFGSNSPFVYSVAEQFSVSELEKPSHGLTVTADRMRARVFIGGDANAYLTEPETGAVIFTDDDAPEFTEPIPPAVPGEDVAGVRFTIRRCGMPAAHVFAMPAEPPTGSASVVSPGLAWKAVRAGTGQQGHLIRTVIGDDRDEATRAAEAWADAARAATVAEVISANPALSLADARAMVTIDRTARGADADEETDITTLINETREYDDPTAGDS